MEKVGMADLIMPRLKILQQLSPEVNKRRPEYIEGAEPGMILNVATLELSETMDVVPCAYIRHHVEWKPNRGGFVTDHGDNELIMDRVVKKDDKNFEYLDNGNIIQPTPTWYALNMNNGGDPCVIPMPRTQSKASRQWMSLATSEKLNHPEHGQFAPPLFFRQWKLSTVLREDGENSWFVWAVERGPSIMETVDGNPESDLVLPADTMPKAQRFRNMIVSGEVRASAEHFADDNDGASSSQRGGESAPM
jgi:hypothetical protein